MNSDYIYSEINIKKLYYKYDTNRKEETNWKIRMRPSSVALGETKKVEFTTFWNSNVQMQDDHT